MLGRICEYVNILFNQRSFFWRTWVDLYDFGFQKTGSHTCTKITPQVTLIPPPPPFLRGVERWTKLFSMAKFVILLIKNISLHTNSKWKRGSSVVRHLPLVLEVPGSIPARGEKNFGVRTRFL